MTAKGRQHDFSLFKESRPLIHPNSLLLADSGYQGIAKHHKNSEILIKKKKGLCLTKADKAHNKSLSKRRIFIENVTGVAKYLELSKMFIAENIKTIL